MPDRLREGRSTWIARKGAATLLSISAPLGALRAASGCVAASVVNAAHLVTMVAALAVCVVSSASADPFPPFWGSAAVHYPPVAWPTEPADPRQCGTNCGEWLPYTRFQNDIADPRTQDPSNGGTAPQNYVNISSSCIDKTFPSIYYALRQGAAANGSQDVIMFRWRVEQIANNYATGPSPGTYGASDPWSSALWSVLFDVNGDGFIDLAAHLDGSSGSPSAAVDRLVGIWSKLPTQSLDYIGDPTNVKLLGHNPTAFVDPGTSRILNFQDTVTPSANWPNGAAETRWDYGTTRSKVVTTSPCNEYFVDYQIPVPMLDASSLGGPKITRSTPISMLFCTANSLNNPFQKDCALNRNWIGASGQPGPFGDYISFNQSAPYAQPIVSSVTASAPTSCPGSYNLSATVQDTLAVVNGTIVPSVKAVRFHYYYDTNGNGLADDGGAWTFAANATLKTGTLNTWLATWDATSLAKGQYLIGVQAVDDNTKVDDSMTPTGIDNRTFSYVAGDAQNRINVGGVAYVTLPAHSPPQTPTASENWWGNPSVTGTQTALVGVANNACGVAPTLAKSANVSNVAPSGAVDFTLTLSNSLPSAITVSQISDSLPAGFTFGSTLGGSMVPTTSPSSGASGTVTWTFAPPISIPAASSGTLQFRTSASATAGNYNNTATATTSFGAITSAPAAVAVDSARLSLAKTPSTYSINPDGTTQLIYTFAYSNASSVSVTGAQLSDVLPAGVSFVGCSGGTSCGNSGGTVTWTLGSLAGGASGTATLGVTVNVGYANTSLVNSAMLTASDPAGNPVTTTASSTIAVNQPAPTAPAFTLTKSANVTQDAPGGSVTWTLAYSNYGTAGATGVTITDTLPAGFTYVSCAGGTSCSNTSGTITWNVGAVAAGASGTVTVTATAANPFTSPNPAVNNASVNWMQNIGAPIAASAQVGITGQACSTYYFRKTTGAVGFDGTKQLATTVPVPQVSDVGGSTTITVPGGANNYSATVLSFYQDPAAVSDVVLSGNTLTTNMYLDRNAGPGITIRTTVYDYNSTTGARVQLGQGTQSFTGSATGLLTFTTVLSGTLSNNHRLLWTYEATSNNVQSTSLLFQYDGTVPNSISDTTPPISTTFANSRADFCVTPPANLTLAKTVDQASVTGGVSTAIQYTLTFANTGQTKATGTQVIDTLPAGVTFGSATLNGSAVTPGQSGQQLTFANVKSSSDAVAGEVSAGASGKIVINATVGTGASGSLVNTASVSSTQTSAVNAMATTTVINPGGGGTPALAISLTADRSTAQPGDTVTYSVTVVNIGTASANAVQLSDVLPVSSYYTFGVCSGGCINSSGTLTWNAGTLAVGASATYTFTMIAGGTGLPAGVTVIPDTASASATSVAPVTSATVNVALNGNPRLSLSKIAAPSSGLVPGSSVNWTLTVSNPGNASATAVVVTDPIPAHSSFAGNITASAGSGTFDAVNNRVVFDVGTLAAGASATLGFATTVGALPAGNTTLLNSATASAGNAAGTVASASAGATATPVLILQKQAPAQVAYPVATLTAAANGTTLFVNDTTQVSLGQYVAVGGMTVIVAGVAGNALTVSAPVAAPSGSAVIGAIVYSLSVTNTGNATATNVALTDVLPAASTFVTASDAGSYAAGSVTWNLGSLDPGTGRSVLVTLIPGGPGAIVNSASATCGSCALASASANTSAGGLRIVKRTTTPVAAAGGTATYVIDAQNTSSAAIPNVSIDDTLPSGFAYASTTSIVNDGAAVTATTSPAPGDTVPLWGTFSIAAGRTLTITFVANIAVTAGAASYQNAAGAQPIAITLAYDALSSTADDVTVLAPNTGLLQGRVYQDNDNDGIYNPAVDTPLAGIGVTITDAASTTYTLSTDADGLFSRVVAPGSATVDINDADLPPGLTLRAGFTDPSSIPVPNGGTATRDTAYLVAATSPDLLIVKTHLGNFTQGQVGAMYTLTVSNIGGGPSTGQVIVTDTLPTGLSATALSGTGWSCDVPTLTCTRSDALIAGASYPPITLTVNVAANASSSVINGASVSGGGDANAANNSAADSTIIVAGPDLSISKTHTGNFVQGQIGVTYTLTVSNVGATVTAGVVTVTDVLPAGLTATALSGSGWSCDVPTLTCTRADALAAAAGYPPITLIVNVAANAAASVTNTATVSGGGDTNAANNSASDNTTITGAPTAPDLSITKTHVGNFAQSQVGATYTITVTNNGTGPTSGTVTVVDTLPAGLTATAMTGTGWTCTLATLTCTRSDVLAAAGSYPVITVTVNIAANAAASVSNTATVSGGGDTNAANNAASDNTTITATLLPADLSITKTHSGNFTQGQTGAAYTITVTNSGTGPTSGTVTVVDTLPAGLTATGVTGTGWSCTLATLTCTRNDVLAAAGSYPVITVTVNIAANAAASVSNTATVSGGGDTNAANNAASDNTTITGAPTAPDLSITKTHSGNFTQGQIGATYTITVTNSGTGPTSGMVTVVDTLPAGLTATAMTGTGWTCTLATLTCTRSDVLAAAGSYPVITVTVNVAANAGASVSNTATVSGGGDTNAANNAASDNTTIIATLLPADLSITKTHLGNFTQGQVGATYTIAVTNSGTGPTSGTVTVVDALPAGLAAIALSGSGWSCDVPTLTCTRNDALAAGASYPPVTLTVNVGANAPASITNVATVSGGGDGNLANNASTDVVVLTSATIVTPVPTLHEWALVLLAVLLGVWGSAMCRRARRLQ